MNKKNHSPELAALVSNKRYDARLSQSDITRGLGYKGPQFVSNLERGLCSLPSKKINKLSEILNIKPEDVINAMVDDFRGRIERDARTDGSSI